MRPSSFRIVFRGLALGFLALLLTGCSATRLAYSQLDRWIVWRLGDIVTLNAEQSAWLDARLQAHLAWHCRTQMPAYAQWFRALRTEADHSPPDHARLEAHARQLERFIDAVLEQIGPTAAELLARLDERQRAELFTGLDRQLAEARTEYLDPPLEQRQRARAERLASRLERWVGAMTPAQTARIHQWSVAVSGQTAGWLANRQRLQTAVRDALAEPDPGGARLRLVRLFQAPASVRTADYDRQLAHGRTEAIALSADLLKLATDSQRVQLKRRLGELAADFDGLRCAEAAVAATAAGQPPSWPD